MQPVLFSPQDNDLIPNCRIHYFWDNPVYPYATYKGKSAHRIVLSRMLKRALVKSELVDHINGNTLDNRRDNLRLVDKRANARNRHRCKNKTGYFGVHYSPKCARKPYRAQIQSNGQPLFVSPQFKTPQEAALAYNEAAARFGFLTRNKL